MKFVPQQEKYDPTSFKGTQAQDDLPPQDHKQKGKGKRQEEIDAFEEAPKALVKWVPKTAPSSTSSSMTTSPRIPIKMMWILKKKNQRVLRVTPPTYFTHVHFGKDKCKQLPHLALVQGVTNPVVGRKRDKVT